MKKLLMLIAMVMMGFLAMAQTPKISYQAVVRDANNRLLTNEGVTVKVTIGSYVENFSGIQTNANGLLSLQIGGETGFDAIDWTAASTTIKTEVTVVSTSEVIVSEVPVTAVPYALKALKGGLTPEDSTAIFQKIYNDSVVLATRIEYDSTLLAGRITTDSTLLAGRITADSILFADNIGKKADTSFVIAGLAAKADTGDVYTRTQLDDFLGAKADTLAVIAGLAAKADTGDVYTRTQLDDFLGAKADTLSVIAGLAAKADTGDVYTRTQLDEFLGAKADTGDVYTRTQLDEFLGAKADTDMVNTKFVPKSQYSLDSLQFRSNIDTNAKNIVRLQQDTVKALRDEIKALQDSLTQKYALLSKVSADSALLQYGIDTTSKQIRADLHSDTLTLMSGVNELGKFSANSNAAVIIDVKTRFTHEELVDSVVNFMGATTSAELSEMMAALAGSAQYKHFADTVADMVAGYATGSKIQHDRMVALGTRVLSDYAANTNITDFKSYYDSLKKILSLVPDANRTYFKAQLKSRIKSYVNSTEFMNEVKSIVTDAGFQSKVSSLLSDPTVKSSIVNNAGVKSVVNSYLSTNGASAMQAILSAPGSQHELNNQIESYLTTYGDDALTALLTSDDAKTVLANFITNYIGTATGKCALFKALNSIDPTIFPCTNAPSGCTCP